MNRNRNGSNGGQANVTTVTIKTIAPAERESYPVARATSWDERPTISQPVTLPKVGMNQVPFRSLSNLLSFNTQTVPS